MSTSTLRGRLVEEVVIFDESGTAKTGAEALAPDRAQRREQSPGALPTRGLVEAGAASSTSMQQRVEQFLFHQSELLDGKHWRAYIDLFAEDGVYWMPATPEQTEWIDSPSIFAEDRLMMEVRRGRITHPNAWSQAAEWGTSHVIGNVAIEKNGTDVVARSRFHMVELRRDTVRHFAGRYLHVLVPQGDDFRIRLQRVDMVNAQAPYEYVLQAWV
jgi:3-phenylpropionate/cinnamic acid dioxygenase small subunit